PPVNTARSASAGASRAARAAGYTPASAPVTSATPMPAATLAGGITIGGQRQRSRGAVEALAGGDGDQVALGAELGEQVRFGRGGDAEHRDGGGDPDRDAQTGQRRPQ